VTGDRAITSTIPDELTSGPHTGVREFAAARQGDDGRPKVTKKVYRGELARLQLELVKMENWVKARGLRVVVLFEGRDAAGKRGVIKACDLGERKDN
jgi:polyphosphate kinase